MREIAFDPADLLARFDPANRRHEFFRLLEAENKHLNLVSRETSVENWESIFAECLLPLTVLDRAKRMFRLLDVGSGGGFPLVPLLSSGCVADAIAVERTRKKAFALERILHTMDFSAQVVARDFAQASLSGSFDLVTLRYVALEGGLWRQIAPLLSEGGVCVHYGEMASRLSSANVATWSFQSSDDQTVKHFSVVSPENQ